MTLKDVVDTLASGGTDAVVLSSSQWAALIEQGWHEEQGKCLLKLDEPTWIMGERLVFKMDIHGRVVCRKSQGANPFFRENAQPEPGCGELRPQKEPLEVIHDEPTPPKPPESSNSFPVTVKPLVQGPVPLGGRDPADPSVPLAVWLSDDFLVQLYFDARCSHLRLTVNRVGTDEDGMWLDGISWDELQAIKVAVGYANHWAVEVYPPDSEVVNVVNMRHLFLLQGPPAFGWVCPRK